MSYCKYSLVNDFIDIVNSILIEYMSLNKFLVCINIFVLFTLNVILYLVTYFISLNNKYYF